MYALTTAELMERPDLWRAVHKLRHEIFVEEMGWEALRRNDRLEIDQFDHDEAIHHLVVRNGELAGYQRMLPTTRPHLLTEVLQDLYVGTPPSGRNVWELTRYAVARGYRDGRRGVSTVGSELIAGFVEWGLSRGVNKVIIEFEPMWVLRALQLRFLDTARLPEDLRSSGGRGHAADLRRSHTGSGPRPSLPLCTGAQDRNS